MSSKNRIFKFYWESDYRKALENGLPTPNICHVLQTGEVFLNVPSYDSQYLTFEALETGTFTLTINTNITTAMFASVSYSFDTINWVTTNNVDNTEVTVTTPTVQAGKKIYWKGSGTGTCSSSYAAYPSTFSSTGRFNVSGNIMSMKGDNFEDDKTLRGLAFCGLFKDCTTLISAENLILPATTFTGNYVYDQMFRNCTNLVAAPKLPATDFCGQGYVYRYMFYDCASLTTAPELPSTTLTNACYQYMFGRCTSLTEAPELPATTLASYCYQYMFISCTNLNYIKALFTTTPDNSYTNSWVSGVAATGTFVKSPDATWDVTGVNGVPEGWTTDTFKDYFTTEALDDGVIIFTFPSSLNTSSASYLEYSTDSGESWIRINNVASTQVVKRNLLYR